MELGKLAPAFWYQVWTIGVEGFGFILHAGVMVSSTECCLQGA